MRKRLKAFPQWREYSESEHSLFVPTETVEEVRADVLLLEEYGSGGDPAAATAPAAAAPAAAAAPQPQPEPQPAAAAAEEEDDDDIDL
eukprot:COSAG06_NODE_2445_length_6866_cov_9.468450_6_plen_88_part_00